MRLKINMRFSTIKMERPSKFLHYAYRCKKMFRYALTYSKLFRDEQKGSKGLFRLHLLNSIRYEKGFRFWNDNHEKIKSSIPVSVSVRRWKEGFVCCQ